MLDDRLQPQLVWVGVFRGGDTSHFDPTVAAADPRLSSSTPHHEVCDCGKRGTAAVDENSRTVARSAAGAPCPIVPPIYTELALGGTLRNAATFALNAAACYEPCAFHSRSMTYFGDAFLHSAQKGMQVDHELDDVTSGGKVEEEPTLFGGFLKSLGFDQPKQSSARGSDKSDRYVDDGQENKENEGGGITGFFNAIASSVSEAVTAAAAAVGGTAVEQDDHKYLDDEAADVHMEEEDDARDKCCFCIPTAPKDQVKYIACAHKLSEYTKGDDDDCEVYGDKSERCEPSARAHKDFWKCLQRINQTEPLAFSASADEVAQREQIELKWMSSSLGFNRYINRRKELMNRKRCSLKKGLREGTAKLLLQPPEPDMDLAMLLLTLVRLCHCVA
jgi:hypothetical protein